MEASEASKGGGRSAGSGQASNDKHSAGGGFLTHGGHTADGGHAAAAGPEKAEAPAAGRTYRMSTSILVWCALAVVSSLYITIPLTPLFARQFDAPLQAAAWTGSAFSLAYAVGLLLWGTLSDRAGRKPVIVFGLLALAVISPLIGLAGTLPALIALRAVQGLAAASFAPSALAYAAEMYPPGRSVTVVGLITTGFMSAGVAGQIYGSSVGEFWGWTYVFYLLGGIYLLSAVWLGGWLPGGTRPRRNERLPDLLRQFGSLLKQKKLQACYLIAATFLLAFVGMYTGLEAVLTRQPFALGSDQMLLVRAAGLPGVLLSPLAGRLAARFGLRKVLQAGLAMAVIGLASIAGGLMLPAFTLPIVIPMSLMLAAGIAIAIPALIAIIGMLGGEARAIAVTLYTFILFIGATLGPLAVLWTLQTTGRDYAAFVLLTALMLAGWAVSRRLPAPDR